MEQLLDLEFELNEIFENLEKILLENQKINQKELEENIKYEFLNDNDKNKIDTFCASLKKDETITKDLNLLQKKTGNFIKNLSKKLDKLDIEETQKILSSIYNKIKDFNNELPETLNQKGIKSMIFNTKKKKELIIVKYSNIVEEVLEKERELIKQKIKILKNSTKLYNLYEEVYNYIKIIIIYNIVIEKLENPQKEQASNELKIQEMKNNLTQILLNLLNVSKKIKTIQTMCTELGKGLQNLLSEKLQIWKNEIIVSFKLSENSNETNNDIYIDLNLFKKLNIDFIKALEENINICENLLNKYNI